MQDIDNFSDHSNHSGNQLIQGSHHQEIQCSAIPANEVMGFDCDFVETPPDDLLCKICYFPTRDPQQANECCGNTFCAACLDRYIHTKMLGTTQCPCCNKVPFTFVPDKKTKCYVGDLKVFCPNRSLGCDWTGALRSLEQHIAKDINSKKGCPFTKLQCSNSCGVMMERRLIEGHLKSECELQEVEGEYCNYTTGSYQWIDCSHQEEYLKIPVQCTDRNDSYVAMLHYDNNVLL